MLKQALKKIPDTSDGFLRRGKVKSAVSRANYTRGSELFREAAALHGWNLSSNRSIDAALEKYVQGLARDGDSIVLARNAVYGEAWRRGLNLKHCNTLWQSRGALEGWKNLVPDNSRDPCSWPAAVLLINDLISQGTKVDLEAAQCTAVQYDTYTRPSVATALGVQNVVLPPTGVQASYQQVALLLAPREERVSTKTGKFDDSILVGTVNPDRSFVSSLVKQLAANAKSGKRLALFPNLTLHRYQAAISNAAKRCGLSSLKITPHLFRHGGASTDVFEQRLDLQEVAKRGHWGGLLGVKRYEKHARLLKVLNDMSEQQRLKASKLARTIGKTLLTATLTRS